MTSLELWWNTVMNIVVIFGPILLLGAIAIVGGVLIADEIHSNVLSFLLMMASILLVAVVSVGWITVNVKPCGFLDKHFPIEEHIDGHCGDVRTTG